MNEETSIDGDTLDQIINRALGRVDERLLEATYDLNPELAEYGPVLPEGVVVLLPPIPTALETPTIHLWD